MATRTADIHIRMEPTLKSQAEEIFRLNGVTPSDVVTYVYRRAVKTNRSPVALPKRGGVLDMDRMTKEQIMAELEKAVQEVDEGNYHTIEESKQFVRETTGARI